MFTIKHIDEASNEFAWQAVSYSISYEKVSGRPDFMRFQTFDQPYMSGDYTALWTGIKTGDGPLGGRNIIFVMNQHGATVDKIAYETAPENYWGEAVTSTQAQAA